MEVYMDIVTPLELAPCRSCLHSREHAFYPDVDGIDIECVLDVGHRPKNYAIYGASSSAEGQAKCSDYLHDENAW
jgi:hypothetical protein